MEEDEIAIATNIDAKNIIIPPELGTPMYNAEDIELSYKGNRNTGILYEKGTVSDLLMKESVECVFNYTQKDNLYGTADIGVLFKDGTILNFSITQGNITKRTKKLTKCMRNGSGTRHYGIENNSEIEEKHKESYNLALEHRKKHKGEVPNGRWKHIRDCPGGPPMCNYLAIKSSESWNNKNSEYKKEKLLEIFDLNKDAQTNCDGIIFYNKDKKTISAIYKWSILPDFDLNNYLDTFTNHTTNVYHGKKEDYIIRTQVKYNNGIIEGMHSKVDPSDWRIKPSTNYLSSWNCYVDLEKIFKMEKFNIS